MSAPDDRAASVKVPVPTTGARYVLVREESPEGLAYRGHVHLPDRQLACVVRVDAAGDWTAEVEGGDADLAKAAAALVRAGSKGSPRKITRWRA